MKNFQLYPLQKLRIENLELYLVNYFSCLLELRGRKTRRKREIKWKRKEGKKEQREGDREREDYQEEWQREE